MVASLAGLPYRGQTVARPKHVCGDLAHDFVRQFFIQPVPGLRGVAVIGGHCVSATLSDRIAPSG
jgi:hypothetical protein